MRAHSNAESAAAQHHTDAATAASMPSSASSCCEESVRSVSSVSSLDSGGESDMEVCGTPVRPLRRAAKLLVRAQARGMDLNGVVGVQQPHHSSDSDGDCEEDGAEDRGVQGDGLLGPSRFFDLPETQLAPQTLELAAAMLARAEIIEVARDRDSEQAVDRDLMEVLLHIPQRSVHTITPADR